MWAEAPTSTSQDRVIRIDGVFDIDAARHVQAAIAEAMPGHRLDLDLTHVREFHDFPVAMLAESLSTASRVRVVVRGLTQHQRRLLRYLGVDAGPDARPDDS